MIDRVKSLIRRVPAKFWAVLIGAVLGLVCSYVPHEWRAPCDLASRVLPATCSSSQGEQP